MCRSRPVPSLELLAPARRKIPFAGSREAWCILSPATRTIPSAGPCVYSPLTTPLASNLGMRRRAHYLLKIRWRPSKDEIFPTSQKFRKRKPRHAAKSFCSSESASSRGMQRQPCPRVQQTQNLELHIERVSRRAPPMVRRKRVGWGGPHNRSPAPARKVPP